MRLFAISVMQLAICFCCALSGQEIASSVKKNPSQRIPGLAYKQLRALGARMSYAGREKTTYAGQLFDRLNNSTTVRITQDVYGLVRLEGFRADEELSFDGRRLRNSSDDRKTRNDAEIRADEDLMEVFLMDSVEGMMESLRQGAAVRFLGNGFRPDPREEPNYTGPRYDVYEVTAPVKCRMDKQVRLKRYLFDNATGLLLRTSYFDRSGAKPVKMETRFSAWGEIDGSKYPARIQHYVGGKLQFDFIAESIASEKSADKAEY